MARAFPEILIPPYGVAFSVSGRCMFLKRVEGGPLEPPWEHGGKRTIVALAIRWYSKGKLLGNTPKSKTLGQYAQEENSWVTKGKKL